MPDLTTNEKPSDTSVQTQIELWRDEARKEYRVWRAEHWVKYGVLPNRDPTNPEPKKIVKYRATTDFKESPLYDESPIDLTVGLHFCNSDFDDFHPYSKTLADFEINHRFEAMKKLPESYLPCGHLRLGIYVRPHPFPLSGPIMLVGCDSLGDWVHHRPKVLALREKWFPDLHLPIRYYLLVYDDNYEDFSHQLFS